MPRTTAPTPTPAEPEALPRVLSPAQLAALMGVPLKTVYGWQAAGKAPESGLFGKHRRYRREDVEAWLAQRAGDAGAA